MSFVTTGSPASGVQLRVDQLRQLVQLLDANGNSRIDEAEGKLSEGARFRLQEQDLASALAEDRISIRKMDPALAKKAAVVLFSPDLSTSPLAKTLDHNRDKKVSQAELERGLANGTVRVGATLAIDPAPDHVDLHFLQADAADSDAQIAAAVAAVRAGGAQHALENAKAQLDRLADRGGMKGLTAAALKAGTLAIEPLSSRDAARFAYNGLEAMSMGKTGEIALQMAYWHLSGSARQLGETASKSYFKSQKTTSS